MGRIVTGWGDVIKERKTIPPKSPLSARDAPHRLGRLAVEAQEGAPHALGAGEPDLARDHLEGGRGVGDPRVRDLGTQALHGLRRRLARGAQEGG